VYAALSRMCLGTKTLSSRTGLSQSCRVITATWSAVNMTAVGTKRNLITVITHTSCSLNLHFFHTSVRQLSQWKNCHITAEGLPHQQENSQHICHTHVSTAGLVMHISLLSSIWRSTAL
jgi:hypothetical protein